MTFEEKFPSLKEDTCEVNFDTDLYVSVYDIDKSCLDKKKVAEAIDKYLGSGNNEYPLTEQEVDDLKKELGL